MLDFCSSQYFYFKPLFQDIFIKASIYLKKKEMTGKKKMKSMHGYLVRVKKSSKGKTKRKFPHDISPNLEEMKMERETESPNNKDDIEDHDENPENRPNSDNPDTSMLDNSLVKQEVEHKDSELKGNEESESEDSWSKRCVLMIFA